MADQLRKEIKEISSVNRKDSERVQTEIIQVIRELVTRGEIELVDEDDEEVEV